ncbi:zinc ABC transporter substrate-binding protein [Cronobacter dublinensis]|nr:zinc ABC transporter substrate-binding protein [Cronobacter dublinensis]EKF2291466.1 zinc ABC transporter substrate-binding protein [Cronobacter dublinensis]EKF2295481.1 zinc ABC transporter substrate-binding protein [Cronobacter dublinensis]EKM0136298.1 zinc ABC transporter substrate-binding protein [Cronobacter dublinensis]EKM0148448.1 zinc ABC transporter substrate-binding protein [Cronobacter dublinensis]
MTTYHMNKNDIYVKMLSLSLPYIRSIQSLDKEEKGRDMSCYYEAELVHNLMHSLLIAEFTEHDLWFLNNQAKYYFEECSEEISPNYNQQISYIRELFAMVPDSLRSKLFWTGP